MGIYCDAFACVHVNGSVQEVQKYIEANNPRVIALAKGLGCSPRRLYDYIKKLPYKTDVEYDKWETASEAIDIIEKGGALDCLGRSTLLASMLIACGYDAWISVVHLPKRATNHAYVEMRLEGEVVKIETTCGHCIFYNFVEEEMIKFLDFNDAGVLKIYR